MKSRILEKKFKLYQITKFYINLQLNSQLAKTLKAFLVIFLNWSRENFRDKVKTPIVLLIPTHICKNKKIEK